MTQRQRFLDILRSVTGGSSASGVRRGRRPTSLRLESLEDRRVLAVAITDFTPTDTGFVVEFDEAVDTSTLNLYDTESGAMGPADVTLTGTATGAVNGSLVVDGNMLTFVATVGVLPADTYNVVLRSAENGFRSLSSGELLDGDNNGTAGGNFTTSFTVAASSGLVVSIPDFARGPSQLAQAPATGAGETLPSGLPVRLSNADGVTSMTVTLEYDPTLLEISDVELGADAPAGSQIEVNLTTPGSITVAFFALDPMPAGEASVFELVGQVPSSAAYGTAHVLRMTSIDVNAGAIAAQSDDALHVVAFAGDVNGNRRYDAEDARLIARVGVGLDTGFVTSTPTSTAISQTLFPLIDPMILGDVTGAGGISPLDASDVLRKVVGLSVPNLPDLPSSQGPFALNLSNQSLSGNVAAGTTVGTFTSSDPDPNDTFTYSLVTGTGGTDNASFSISGNTLRSAATLTPAASPYSIRVRTTDAAGNSLERVFSITVTANNTSPTGIALSSSSFPENTTPGTAVATLSSTDANAGDTFTYSLVSGSGSADNGAFSISGNQLLLSNAVNFETKSSYSIRLRTTDQGGLSFEQPFTLTVTNSNDAPTAIAITATDIASGAPIGTLVGTLSTTDEDAGDTHTYALVSGTGATDNALFTISGAQILTAATLNAGTQATYSIRVRSTDSGGAFVERVITGTVVDGNIAPTGINLSSTSFPESTPLGTTIATLSSVDANVGDTFTYSLVSGTGATDNSAFTISGNQLVLDTVVDFEAQANYSIRLRTTDAGGLSFEQVVALTVTDSNDAPTAIAISDTDVVSGAPSGTVVGTLSTTDQDAGDTHTYSLVSGVGADDNASFAISGNQLLTATAFDIATQTSYSIRIRSTDSGGAFVERIIVGNVVDTNVAPTGINLSATNFPESTAPGTTIANLSSVDANAGDTFTYSLVDGIGDSDNISFSINGDELVLNETVDYETKSSYSIRLRTTDSQGLTFEEVFELRVTDSNDAPLQISLSATDVPANAAVGTLVGTLSTFDQDVGDTHTYTLVAGTGANDNDSFTISGDQLVTAVTFDAETQTSYSIRLRSTDSGGAFIERIFSGDIVDSNEAPTALTISSTEAPGNVAVGTSVGTFTTSDPDANDTHTYSLVAGEGDIDNASFAISGNQLLTAVVLDPTIQSTYSIRVRTTDSGGAFIEEIFVGSVVDVNLAPTSISLSNASIAEDVGISTLIGTFSTIDPNLGDSHSYELIAGEGDDDNDAFVTIGSDLRNNTNFDFETKNTYSIRIRSTDAGGLSIEQQFTIFITDVNEAATQIDLSNASIADASPSGTVVGELSANDPDAGDTLVFALATGSGDTDNSSFSINGTQLVTNFVADLNSQSNYSVRVSVTDALGLVYEQILTITVAETNVAPTGISLSSNTLPEDSPIGSAVGSLSTSDPNAADSHVYSLVAGEGDTDNLAFEIAGGELRVLEALDFETKSSYTVRVRSTDSGGLFVEQVLTINIVDVNEAPTAIALSNDTIPEDSAVGTVVGTLATSDPDAGDSHTYSLTAGEGDTDNSLFSIVGNELRVAGTFDFAAQPTYSIRIQSADNGGLLFEQIFTITVTEANQAPTEIILSSHLIFDGASAGTVVGTLSATDPNAGDTASFALIAGDGSDDNDSFSILGNELSISFDADMAVKSSYQIRVQVTDSAGATFEQNLILLVVETPVAPTDISLTATNVAENVPIGTIVAMLSTTDANTNDSHVYALVAGDGDADNGMFAIDGNLLVTAAEIDFESQSSFTIRVRSTDAFDLFVEKTFVITVDDVNEAPLSVSLTKSTIADQQPAGSLVGLFQTIDPDAGDTFTYSLVTGTGDTDNAHFQIDNGRLQMAASVDAAVQALYSVRVRSQDAGGLFVDEVLEILVSGVNQAPTDIVLSSSTIAENTPVGSSVAGLSTTDGNELDTHTYELVAGSGDSDNATFTIQGNQLILNAPLDFNAQSTLTIRIRSTDPYGLSIEEELVITVTEAL